MENIQLLTKIATLYYKGGLNQQEIADRLGLSRQTTGRCLKRALDLGIVIIKIQSNLEYSAELEYKMESLFGLSEVIVVTPPTDSEDAVKEALGSAGAAFLERRVLPWDIIGISWSSTVLQCAMQLPKTNPRNVTVVQLNGSMDRTSFSTRAEFIVERIAQAFEGKTVGLLTPMLVDDRSIKESFLRDSKIAATLQLASDAQLALFGVGNVSEQSSLYKTGYLDDVMLAHLKDAGAVGEICGRFYDHQGNISLPEMDERTIAVDLNNLRGKRISAAIAAGANKVDAILGMLRGGFCNVLITSEETAKSLLTHASGFQKTKNK